MFQLVISARVNKEDNHSFGKLFRELSNRYASQRILLTVVFLFCVYSKITSWWAPQCLCTYRAQYHSTGGVHMGQSPGHVLPRVIQLVQCLCPYGNLSHSQNSVRVVPGGYCGQCSVKGRLPLMAASGSLFYGRSELWHAHVPYTLSTQKFQNSPVGFLSPPSSSEANG